MELDAIAGVYIGGTSAAGGVASIAGSIIGALMLVVIRSGLNFVLAKFNMNVNSTYVTYVLTGIIVVIAVLLDVIKNKNAGKVRIDTPAAKYKREYKEQLEALRVEMDYIVSDKGLTKEVRQKQVTEKKEQIADLKDKFTKYYATLKAEAKRK